MFANIQRVAGRTCQLLGLLAIVVGAYALTQRGVEQPGAASTDQPPTLLLIGALLFLVGTLLERRAPG